MARIRTRAAAVETSGAQPELSLKEPRGNGLDQVARYSGPPAVEIEGAELSLLFKQRDRARKPDRHAGEKRLSVDLPVDLAVLQCPLETENRVRQWLVHQRAARDVGAEGEADQTVAALGTPLRSQPAGGAIGQKRQIAQLEIEVEVGRTAGEGAIGRRRCLVVENAQLSCDNAGLAARQAAGDAVSPASRLSTGSLPIPRPDATLSIDRSNAPLIGLMLPAASMSRAPDSLCPASSEKGATLAAFTLMPPSNA